MTTLQASVVPATATQLVGVTSELMQDYRLATPVTAATQIALAPTASGQVEVFSIGANNHIYNIYPDPGSDTGWSQVDLNFPAKAQYVAVTTDPSGAITVYAADNANNLYSIVGPPWGSGWQTLPNHNFIDPNQKLKVGGLRSYADSGGNDFLIVLDTTLVQDGTTAAESGYYIFTAQGWQSFGYNPSTVADWAPARAVDRDGHSGLPGRVLCRRAHRHARRAGRDRRLLRRRRQQRGRPQRHRQRLYRDRLRHQQQRLLRGLRYLRHG